MLILLTAVLLMALYPLMPESPHYLAVNGRLLEAQDVLHRISSWNRRPLPPGTLVADGHAAARGGEQRRRWLLVLASAASVIDAGSCRPGRLTRCSNACCWNPCC